MKGKIVFITGSTQGIGKQTAVQLAECGATVLLHARTATEGEKALDELQKIIPNGAFDLFIANLAEREEIKRLACDINAAYARIDILINNAATYCPVKQYNSEKIEMTFAVNHLACFYLTHLLMPLLRNTSHTKIINIGSHAHYTARFDVNNLQGEKLYNGINHYCNSKLHTLLFTYGLARKLTQTNITVNAVHPGLVATKLYTSLFTEFDSELLVDATDTIIYLCTSVDVEGISGEYFMSRLPVQSSYNSYKTRYQKQLWNYSEKLLNMQGSKYQISEQKHKHQIPQYLQKILRLCIRKVFRSKESTSNGYIIN